MKRRDFMKELSFAGGQGLILSAFPWLQACSETEIKELEGEKIKTALIGTGSRGQYHIFNLQNYIPQAEVVALCDIYQPHLDQASALYPNAKTYTDYRQILDRKDIKAVIISTPLHMHDSITIDALNAGKHVFCEKSMARTLDGCLEMYQTYKRTGKILYIGQQRLFDPKYLKAMKMIHDGVIGDITSIRAYWFRNNDWRRPVKDKSMERQINWRLYKEYSAGLLTELATHQLQVGNWAMKQIPETIMASGDIVYWKDGREVYDNISMICRYPNGVKMNYESVISNKFHGLEEEILGSKGTMLPEKNKYYFEEVKPAPGIMQLINKIEHGIFDNIAIAGPSWVPETANENNGHFILENVKTTDGASSVGAVGDGSIELLTAFFHSITKGKEAQGLVEEAYYSSVLALLAEQAMEQQRIITFPEAYKIPYLNM